MLRKLYLIIHTVRYLRLRQINGRITLKFKNTLFKSFIIKSVERTAQGKENFRKFGLLPKAIPEIRGDLSRRDFNFLNHIANYRNKILWNDSHQEKLWLYNLHYFDYLLPLTKNPDAQQFEQAKQIISDWIKNNTIGHGNGWEPYPISLRAANWIFFYDAYYDFFEKEPDFKKTFLTSLYRQVQYLTYFLEFHLLANHFWANVKALVFGGVFFNNERWTQKGLRLLKQEIAEQILPDGGHYERSPMYHSIILTDVLDLYNLLKQSNSEPNQLLALSDTVERMISWLRQMVHPDGDIALFGDAAFGIAAKPDVIFEYADKLGMDESDNIIGPSTWFTALLQSGYIVFNTNSEYLAFDGGDLGVHYQPGHVHCDLLSFEYSYKGKRFIVDSGVGNYLPGELRKKARSIFSHNTIAVNGTEQAEIWSAFRVGRRVKNPKVVIDSSSGGVTGSYSNNLNKNASYTHKRKIQILEKSGFKIYDKIESNDINSLENIIHIHPAVKVDIKGNSVLLNLSGHRINIEIMHQNCKFELRDWFFTPEFGKVISSQMIVIHMNENSGFYIIRPL